MGTEVRKPLFVGIGHKKQQGKDTVAMTILEALGIAGIGAVVAPFAGPLKMLASSCYGLSLEQCWGSEEEKNTMTNINNNSFSLYSGSDEGHDCLTARELLQNLGTTLRSVCPGIFTKAPFRKEWGSDIKVVLIPDLRFKDEAQMLLDNGGMLIRVVRDDEHTDTHSSEVDLDGWNKWTATIFNNGTKEDLQVVSAKIAARLAAGEPLHDDPDVEKIYRASEHHVSPIEQL